MEDTVVVGRHAIREAIITGHPINKILVQEEGIKSNKLMKFLKMQRSKIIVQTVPKSKLDFWQKHHIGGCSAYCTIWIC